MDLETEQSDIGLHCLTKRFLKHFSSQQRQMTFVLIGTLWVNNTLMLEPLCT